MLHYTISEGSMGSHFFITTPIDNILVLAFKNLDIEELHFNNDFLQEFVVEMVVAKVTYNSESYCKEVAQTIKHIFDYKLEKDDNAIIYICVAEKSLKYQLILRFIESDENDHFKCLYFKVEEKVFCFFFNEQKTSTVETWSSLIQFFQEEYGIYFGTSDK